MNICASAIETQYRTPDGKVFTDKEAAEGYWRQHRERYDLAEFIWKMMPDEPSREDAEALAEAILKSYTRKEKGR